MSERNSNLNSKSVFISLGLILLAVFIAYYPSLAVPFYLDDRDSIITNVRLHGETMEQLWNSWYRSRIVGYSTLWANYQYGGLDPTGYHFVNIVIHILNSVLVFFLMRMLLNYFTPQYQREEKHNTNQIWALIACGLWALHPLNSQAVIYIVQRLASMVTIFYLLSIMLYIKVRQADALPKMMLYGGLLLVCLVAGMLTKQNFATVFVFLYLWELYNAPALVRRILLQLTALGITLLLLISPFIPEFWQALDNFTRDFMAGTRTEYFYSQMVVLWDYVLKFVYPFPLQLEIQATLRTSLDGIVALAMLGHIAMLILAFRLRNRLPLFFVGVLLFYTSHLVESFIIPIKDLAFEHRTYIGNIGLVLVLISLVKAWIERQSDSLTLKPVLTVFAALMLFNTAAIYQRAVQWQEPLAFYGNEVEQSPNHARTNASYGNELLKKQQFEEAERYLKKSIDLDQAQNKVSTSALIAYMTVLYEQKKYQAAAQVVMKALKYVEEPIERSMLLSNLAVGYIYMGYCDFALGLLGTAIQLNPNNEDAKSNRAYCLEMNGAR